MNQSLTFICAYQTNELVGFVNLAWDGGIHAFVLDTTVRPDARRKGIGIELVNRAVEVAKNSGIKWVHVDYKPNLSEFYRKCGFIHTEAGIMRL